jgi:DNA-binding transcriptional ArsR family regulator
MKSKPHEKIILLQKLHLSAVKALSNDKRLLILYYLKNPKTHFPAQIDGDLIEDGVCADFIREKLGLSAATTTQHLKVLAGAGLVRGKRCKKWVFYKRCEKNFDALRIFFETI